MNGILSEAAQRLLVDAHRYAEMAKQSADAPILVQYAEVAAILFDAVAKLLHAGERVGRAPGR